MMTAFSNAERIMGTGGQQVRVKEAAWPALYIVQYRQLPADKQQYVSTIDNITTYTVQYIIILHIRH
jgi:hypothetical protein